MSTDTAPQHAPRGGEKTRVLLLFGGRSSEHSISCVTAAGVLGAIDHERFDVVPVGITRTGHWVRVPDDPASLTIQDGRLPEVPESDSRVVLLPATDAHELLLLERDQAPVSLGRIDVVFPLLHGPFGEDGSIQGLLELGDIRYVGCGVASSAMMMDKHLMKLAFEAAGIPVSPYEVVTDRQWAGDREAALARCERLQFPVFVKPTRAGSSMGISKVAEPAELASAIEAAREHDPKVLVEQGIVGREIECAVLGGRGEEQPRASVPGEIVVREHEFYDFEAKYLNESDVTLSAPAELSPQITERVRGLAVEAFIAGECEGLARCDFFVTPEGDVIINEVNTMPGFTPFSMFPAMWAATGMPYPELIADLIDQAMERRVGLR